MIDPRDPGTSSLFPAGLHHRRHDPHQLELNLPPAVRRGIRELRIAVWQGTSYRDLIARELELLEQDA